MNYITREIVEILYNKGISFNMDGVDLKLKFTIYDKDKDDFLYIESILDNRDFNNKLCVHSVANELIDEMIRNTRHEK